MPADSLPTNMTVVEMRAPGGPDVLEHATRPVPNPAPNEVLVKIAAAGVGGPDLVQRRGAYPPPKGASDLLGLEVSGTVVARGDAVDRWTQGDKITALTNGGGYAEYVAIHADHCLPLPPGVSLEDAAGLPETYFTVWSNLFFNHALPAGANLLVHGGAGGIGSTALQIGHALGLQVFTTVEDDAAAAFVTELGAARAIRVPDEDFVPICREAGGMDLILDIIGGEYLARNVKAARHDARIVNIAFNAGSRVEFDFMPVMLKRLTLTGSTLRSRPDSYKAALARDLEETIWPLFAAGRLKPVTHSVLPLTEAAEAHRLMASARHHGKILLRP